jgi:two-component system chemotaxis response regulator CheB
MTTVRVLIVDDSAVIRRVLREALLSDAMVELAGIAADGLSALKRIEETKPDLVTLDVELPGMSGLETLKEIRARWPKLPVIMFSTLTERGAVTTLEALTLGASDYVTKPSNSGNVEETKLKISAELIPKIKALCERRQVARGFTAVRAPVVPPPSELTARIARKPARIEIVAVGTSTGGPNALGEFLPKITRALAVPIVLVRHMPALFTRYLAERLAKLCALRVAEGNDGQEIRAGEVWIAPGDYHMTVEKSDRHIKLRMNQQPRENSCRPAVDVLFRSVAEVFGGSALGVVLTGMGSDGVRGADRICARGGKVIVQDEASSVVWGMPGQVAAAGFADGIYPLSEMAREVEQRVAESAGASLLGSYLQLQREIN